MKLKDPKRCTDTGRIRGLLYNLCNVGLGALRESPSLLSKAIEYLEVGNGIRGRHL